MKINILLHFCCKIKPRLFALMLVFSCANLSAQTSDSTIFEDDFNRADFGAFWQANLSWSIQNGAAYNFVDGTGGTLKTTASFEQTSYIIETTAYGFVDNYMREYRITFGQRDLANDSMYVLSYEPNNGGILTLSRSANNIYYPKTLDEAVIYPEFNAVDLYKFKIARYKSGLIQVYVDKGAGYGNTPFLEAIDSAYATAGHIGWQIDTQAFPQSFYVDDISAVKPGIEKPAVKEKPAQDDLITQVSAKSGNFYNVAKLNPGVSEYTDRDYKITSVPEYLQGASFIQTAMDDNKDASDTFLTFFVKKPAIIYIGYDSRATILPAWLNDWTKIGDSISAGESGSLQIYGKAIDDVDVYPNPFFVGGNLAGHAYGADKTYLVAAVLRPEIKNLQAEDAFLSGAVAASNHPGYHGTGFADFKHASKDYIEWTVKIDVPGTYNLGFTFANGDGYYRPVQINNNGANIDTVSFSPTSSWSSWAFYSGPNVFLTSGIHKIRATAIGSSGPNIDELSLYYESSKDLTADAQKPIRNNPLISYLSNNSLKIYPNPFIRSTKIFYSLKEKRNVTLSVYTLQGQHLQTLVNGAQNAGNYQVTFNAGKLSAGTYLYRLQTGNEVKTGKLIKQ